MMIDRPLRLTARQRANTRPLPQPARDLCQGAGAPFNVHGHRLSSLYRATISHDIPFNVLKILQRSAGFRDRFEYFRNIEKQGTWL